MILAPKTTSNVSGQQWKSLGFCLLSVLTISVLFLAVSLLSSPIPGVNEPHYLCKARSFFDSDWCRRDFFLASTDAHYCFFWMVGPLTQMYSFETAAIIGRSVSALILAGGWTILGRATGLSNSYQILSAGLFAFLSQLGSFSGEWLLDGFESKVAAWGLGLAAVGFWIRATLCGCPQCMVVAGIFCGAGAMLHPVVGGWIAVCICMVWLFDCIVERRSVGSTGVFKSAVGIVGFSCATILAALPGLVPAVQLLLDNSLSTKDRELASFIQVFWRLKHHLDPTELTSAQWMYAAGLLTLSIVAFVFINTRSRFMFRDSQEGRGSCRADFDAARREPCPPANSDVLSIDSKIRFNLLLKFFLASLAIAIAGVAIGWHVVEARDMSDWQWRAALLKFYPFRTFDAMLPIVVGMFVALILQENLRKRPKGIAFFVLIFVCGLPFVPAALHRETTPPGYTAEQFADWKEACKWIRTETSQTTLFLTPRESFAFKWFAQRPEYVCYKDCPQDAAGILEWNRRLWWLHDWTLKSSTDGTYNLSDLEALRAETGCDYILTRILGPFDTTAAWQGKHWQIIRVP